MRPPEFTGGNARRRGGRETLRQNASMRPPEFTGGNDPVVVAVTDGFVSLQ